VGGRIPIYIMWGGEPSCATPDSKKWDTLPRRFIDATMQCFHFVRMSMPDPHGGWIENLRYHVEVLATPDRIKEVVARVGDLTTARAVFDLIITQRPGKLVLLCQGARVLRRSDRS